MSPLTASLRRLLAASLVALLPPGAMVLALATQDEKPSAAESGNDDESPATSAKEAKPSAPGAAADEAVDFNDGDAADNIDNKTDAAAAPDQSDAPSDGAKKPGDAAATDGPNPPAPTPGPHRPSVASGAQADGKFTLAYKFKKGEVIRWEVVHRAVVDTTIQGTNQSAETRSTSIKAWQVTDVTKDGRVTLVHSVESIDMWQKMQGRQEVRYNSRTDDKVPGGYEEIAKAVGVPLTVVTLDPHGKVLKREEKHRQTNNSNMPLAIPLPAEPVPVGYSWSEQADVEVILHGGTSKKVPTRQKFVLENVIAGMAIIN
ncbi:MAG TPA: hypothetical protein VMF30_09890, partial [Pirellulales bacterium]|nr:hypothetical protein [Pirellulales bacterium]